MGNQLLSNDIINQLPEFLRCQAAEYNYSMQQFINLINSNMSKFWVIYGISDLTKTKYINVYKNLDVSSDYSIEELTAGQILDDDTRGSVDESGESYISSSVTYDICSLNKIHQLMQEGYYLDTLNTTEQDIVNYRNNK